MISTFGTVQIAANAVANNLDGVGVLAGAAMNLAILTVVGRCVGAHDNDQVRYYTRRLLKIEYAMMVAVNVVLLAALPLILDLYTLSPASRELATQLVFIHDGFAMLLWPLALSMPNALRAANDVKFTMVPFHRLDGLLPHCAELYRRREDGLRRAGRVVCDAGGLAVPRGGLYLAL